MSGSGLGEGGASSSAEAGEAPPASDPVATKTEGRSKGSKDAQKGAGSRDLSSRGGGAEESDAVRLLIGLSGRLGDVEDALAEVAELLDKVRRRLDRIEERVATRKQVKKLKKVLDQLDVIEVGPEDAPAQVDGDEV